MNKIFNRPQIIDEAAKVSVDKRTGKAGQPLYLEIPIMIAVFFFAAIAEVMTRFIIAIPASAISGGDLPGSAGEILTLFSTLAATVLTILFMVILQKRKLRTAGFVKKNALPHYLIGLAVGAVMFCSALLICSLCGSITIDYAGNFTIGTVILTFIGYMIQGNSEEVICRGFMLVSASRRYPVWVGVVLNSVLFAAMHLANPGITVLAFINLSLFGIVMSLLFLRTGNIWMVSALHTIWNFVQGPVFGVLVSGGTPETSILTTSSDYSKAIINGGDFGLEGGLAVTAILVITTVILIFIKPCKGVDAKDTEAVAEAA